MPPLPSVPGVVSLLGGGVVASYLTEILGYKGIFPVLYFDYIVAAAAAVESLYFIHIV